VGGYAPRALKNIVRPRRLVGASGRPLNFTVRRWPMNVSIPPLVARRTLRPVKQTLTRLRMAVLYGFLLFVSLTALGSAPNLKVGDAPPDVFGKSSTGEAVHLSDYRGRIVVISFWATWCGPCRKELPVLVNLEKKATREKVVVLSVNWRQSYDEFRQIKKIFKDMETDITLISDERGRVGDAYGVKGIPHMIIVGRDGKIAAIHVGYSESVIPLLVDEINSAWSKAPSEVSSTN
jgi:thiol-disulfide isomerase/thioredoxin